MGLKGGGTDKKVLTFPNNISLTDRITEDSTLELKGNPVKVLLLFFFFFKEPGPSVFTLDKDVLNLAWRTYRSLCHVDHEHTFTGNTIHYNTHVFYGSPCLSFTSVCKQALDLFITQLYRESWRRFAASYVESINSLRISLSSGDSLSLFGFWTVEQTI